MSGLTEHREAVEALLVAAGVNLAASSYRVVTHIDGGPGADDDRRGSGGFGARDFLVHTNIHAQDKGQAEAVLDRVMSIETRRPVVEGRLCDPLTVYIAANPANENDDLVSRDVWSASVVWRLRSYAA